MTRPTSLGRSLAGQLVSPIAPIGALWQLDPDGKSIQSKTFARRQKLTTDQQSLIRRLPLRPGDPPYVVVTRPGVRKMSEMLLEVADPWTQQAQTDIEPKYSIHLAAVAWNLALFPEPERWSNIDREMIRKIGEYDLSLLRHMVARKLVLFPDNHCQIIKYDVTGENRKYRVNVSYQVSREEVGLVDSFDSSVPPK